MDALILSCGTGGGHDAAARAIQEELIRRGDHSLLMNPYTLYSDTLPQKIDRTYISTVQKSPAAFGAVYAVGECYRKLPFRSPVYLANRKMASTMAHFLNGHHFDVVIMTHLFPAEIFTYMKLHDMPVPKMLFIATDYTCIPFTEETECDAYVIPSPMLTEEFIDRGIPAEKLYPLGIPVSGVFTTELSMADEKKKLGLEQSKNYILVSGGSMGAGKMEETLDLLTTHKTQRPDLGIIAICGNNEKLYRHLTEKYGDNVLLIHHTDDMASYMRASSLYLTKPGGLSSTEAAVLGTSLIHMPPIPGCETKNAHFFEENGMSRPLQLTDSGIDKLLSFMDDDAACKEMVRCQKSVIPDRAAAHICDLAAKLSGCSE